MQVKATMTIFFNITDVIMTGCVYDRQTVNKKYYCEVLVKLQDKYGRNYQIVHLANALTIRQFLANNCRPVLKHSLHSPNLVSCDS
jgi:hypothetical protein